MGYSTEVMEQLRVLFDEYDEDGGGTIDRDELHNGLSAVFQALYPQDTRAISPGGVQRQREREAAFIADIAASLGDAQEIDFPAFCKLMGPSLAST